MQIATVSFDPLDFSLTADQVWSTELAHAHLCAKNGEQTKRTTERSLHQMGIWPSELSADKVRDELGRPANSILLNWQMEKARSARRLVLFVQQHLLPNGQCWLHANDARGARYWVLLSEASEPKNLPATHVITALGRLQQSIGKDITVIPHNALVAELREAPESAHIAFALHAFLPVLEIIAVPKARLAPTPHLKRLEDESIHILREAVAEAENPVMLYSVGKDSGVMLHLARKAFYPSPPPFPLMHVDTRWKFQEMYLFRDQMALLSGMDLLVHINPEAIAKDINPFDHGSALHTDITKTEGLKQALDKYKFDIVFGGARRDEEKSRAKERIFSFRSQTHRWDPKQQRPELWNLFNARKSRGESIRVFRCPTGLNSISGNIYTKKTSQLCPSTSQNHGQ
jgi:sulfate adenylyltransferase subunit 2